MLELVWKKIHHYNARWVTIQTKCNADDLLSILVVIFLY